MIKSQGNLATMKCKQQTSRLILKRVH